MVKFSQKILCSRNNEGGTLTYEFYPVMLNTSHGDTIPILDINLLGKKNITLNDPD